EKSIQNREVTTVVEEDGPTWMMPLMEYLKDGTLPDDRNEASKLRIKARQYELLEGVLYRRLSNTSSRAKKLPTAADSHHCSMAILQRKEAKAVETISSSQVKKFVWDNIVCCFGLPGEIVSKNGKQLSDNSFKDWCEKMNITQRFALVKYPQSNGLVERESSSLEAVIPAKVRMPTYRTAVVEAVHNDEELRLNLDLREERRERAAIREAKAKLKMTNNDASHAVDGRKLGPK
ncbi:reverse transcriptase domain-containing protein, partial [Tanacetum coccineum]